jgi:hypothetical protein
MNSRPETLETQPALSARLSGYARLRACLRRVPIILVLAVAAFALKTAMAYLTYGTNDVTTWQLDLTKSKTRGAAALYREGVPFSYDAGRLSPVQVFSHPPSMIHLLRFWGLLAALTQLPLQFWMRFTCALADAGSLIVVWQMGREVPALRFQPAVLMLIAACPVSILISGFHGNTDPIMVFFLLVSIYLIETKRSSACAGSLMGLALAVKVVPVIFIPAAILYLPNLKSRLQFTLSAGAVFIFAGLPYIVTDSFLILHTISHYNSASGIWPQAAALAGIDQELHKKILIASIGLVSAAMNWSRARLPLFAQIGFLTALFLFFAPGFGVQYLAWTVPWFGYLGLAAGVGYYLLAGTALFVIYTYWSGGFPWYVATAFPMSPRGTLLLSLCWRMTGVVMLLYMLVWLKQRAALSKGKSASIKGPGPRVQRSAHLAPEGSATV